MTTDPPRSASRAEESRYAIGELAELGGVSRRTVRYYVQRGLLEAPTGLGRGRHYTQRHLDTLIRIRRLQEAGRPLAEIAARLERPAGAPDTAASIWAPGAGSRQRIPENMTPGRPARSSRWTRLEITDGVELHLRDLQLDPEQIRAVGEAVTRIVQPGGR